jgi:hypothetical protein
VHPGEPAFAGPEPDADHPAGDDRTAGSGAHDGTPTAAAHDGHSGADHHPHADSDRRPDHDSVILSVLCGQCTS